jgi:hypothetical protein
MKGEQPGINHTRADTSRVQDSGNEDIGKHKKIETLRERIDALEAQVRQLKKRLNSITQAAQFSPDRNDTELIAYWPLDEKGGTTSFDMSGNGYSLVNQGAKVGVKAVEGTGYRFDGRDDYLRSRKTDLIDHSAWTVSFWVKCLRGDNETDEMFINQGTRQNNLIGLGNWNRSVVFNGTASPRGGRLDLFPDEVVRDGEFHHVVVQFDAGKFGVFVDSEQRVQKKVNSDHYNWTTGQFPLYLASRGGRAGFFKGIMDEVRVYRGVLSKEAIEDLYGSGSEQMMD